MRFTQYDTSSVKQVFWSCYIMGFMSILGAAFTKYSYTPKNNAKWVGTLLGTIVSMIVLYIVGSIIAKRWILLIIFSSFFLPLSIILTIYVYKKTICKWAKEEELLWEFLKFKIQLNAALNKEQNHNELSTQSEGNNHTPFTN